MKKIILVAFLITLYSISSPGKARATLPVIDYVNLEESILQFTLQGAQAEADAVSAAADPITAVQQELDTINTKVLIPMRDAMTLIMIMKSGENIRNLVSGALGVDPLLIKNPEKYLKSQGRLVIEISINDIKKEGATYKNDLANSIRESTKFEQATLAEKIAVINQSGIPSIEQRERCTDQALTNQAKKDVVEDDGVVNSSALAARKKEISNAICGNIKDPKTLAAISAISRQSPTWTSFMALTNGDNDWNKSERTKREIQAEAEKKTELAKTDLTNGGGIRSETKCILYRDGLCVEKEIIKTAGILNATYQQSIKAPLETALAGFGKGAGSLISTAFTTINILQSMDAMVNSNSSFSGSSSGSGSSVSGNGGGNTSVVVKTSTVQDLATNAKAKENLTSTPRDQLLTTQQELIKLNNIDNDFLNEISSYKVQVDTVKSCYDDLVSTYPDLSGNAQVADMNTFYDAFISSQISSADKNAPALKEQLVSEQNKIKEGKNIITATLSILETSQSSEEILDAFQKYQSDFKAKGIPNSIVAGIKGAKLFSYRTDVAKSTKAPIEVLGGGHVYNLQQACAALSASRGSGGNSSGGI